jgi:hypothetical protein
MLLKCLFLVLVPSVAAATPTTRAETALAALQTWYNTTSGIWNTCGWWNGANCMTVIADLADVDDSVRDVAVGVFENTFAVAPRSNPAPGRGNDTYNGAIKHHRPEGASRRRAGVDVSQWLDGAYDDDAWWALAWIAAFDVTGREEYLDLAVGVFEELVGCSIVCLEEVLTVFRVRCGRPDAAGASTGTTRIPMSTPLRTSCFSRSQHIWRIERRTRSIMLTGLNASGIGSKPAG